MQPFNKLSPLQPRTSLPTPTRGSTSKPVDGTLSRSVSARSLSTPNNYLTSRITNLAPSSVLSLNETPVQNSTDVFARSSTKPEAPRSLPPRFVFGPTRGKENASIPSATPTAPAAATKRKRPDAIIDLDADEAENEEDVLVLGGSQKRRVTPPSSSSSSQERREDDRVEDARHQQVSPTRTNSIRKKLDVFRFRPKVG